LTLKNKPLSKKTWLDVPPSSLNPKLKSLKKPNNSKSPKIKSNNPTCILKKELPIKPNMLLIYKLKTMPMKKPPISITILLPKSNTKKMPAPKP